MESTNDIKLLGVNIDEHLVFSKHISDICVKASQRIGVLGRLRNLIPTEAKLLLYKTSIMPYLTYNVMSYGTFVKHLTQEKLKGYKNVGLELFLIPILKIIIRYLSVLSCLVCITEDYKILLF